MPYFLPILPLPSMIGILIFNAQAHIRASAAAALGIAVSATIGCQYIRDCAVVPSNVHGILFVYPFLAGAFMMAAISAIAMPFFFIC